MLEEAGQDICRKTDHYINFLSLLNNPTRISGMELHNLDALFCLV